MALSITNGREGSRRRCHLVAATRSLAAVVAGELEPVVGGSYPLAEARRAHEDLRSRTTTGKLVLVP